MFCYFFNTFKNLDVEIQNINYKITYTIDSIIVELESKEMNNNQLDDEFFKLYKFMNILIGYYPTIVSGTEFDVSDLAEQYFSSEKHMLSQDCFVKNLDNEIFKTSYKRFRVLEAKNSFVIDYYGFATSRINNYYSEIAIVNILQCLDGMYDNLEITKSNKFILSSPQRIEIFKERIKKVCIRDIVDNKHQLQKLNQKLEEITCRLEYVNFDYKLKYLFNYIDNKYAIFQLEKHQNDKTKNFDAFIKKCKHTRNKFSHSSNIKNCLNGMESAFYLYKIILTFRLLIIDEVGLDSYVEKNYLDYVIEITNVRLIEKLQMVPL